MRKILICLMLMFSTLIFAQVDCYKLKVKGENYALSDSNPETWCEIAEAVNTSFTKCMCEEEKRRKEEKKARDKKIADSQALAKRNYEKENQIRELTVKARELGQNKEYDKALSLLNQAKSIAESYEEVPKVDIPGFTHYSKSDKIGWVQNSIDDMQRAKDNSGGELSLVLSSPSSRVDEKEVASKKEGTKTSSQVPSESIYQKKQREAEEESAEDIERARIVKAKSDELAKRAREAERKRRAEEAENINKISNSFFSGVQEGFFTGLHVGYGSIGTKEYIPFLNPNAYEIGVDVGKGGIYFAFSPNEEEYLGPNRENQDESSLQFTIGLNYDVLNIGELLNPNSKKTFIIGMGLEWGTSAKDVYYNYNNDYMHESSDYTMYGVNFYTKIFKYVYFSYSVGSLKGDYIDSIETTNISTNYNRTVIGLQIPF